MMGAGALLVLAVVCLCSSAVTAEDEASDATPAFCRNLECPKYQVVKKYEDFELRAYEPTQWVSTTMKVDLLGFGMVKSFRRLFKYISGGNIESQKINMTVPVAIYVPVNVPSANATMSFFVSPELSPPRPLDPEVYLESFPAKSVYVKSFGGYAFDYEYARQSKKLAEELTSLGIPFDNSFYVRAGYNDPFTLFNRHNEVWYTAN
ncbi:heme-binding protein 2-like [Spea bombifrons]|uniref:heme-binding protein 2-like n=1 Tax=Spea bombifrons TaxID=233779 RepID=UPI00234986EC|nr:heme-binding protein 2-like [Spea bombifrons]